MNKNEGDEKWCTNPSTFFKIPSQINQNGAQERSEGNLASASAKCLSHFLEKCHHLWEMIDFGRHFWIQLGARRVPQSIFWHQVFPKSKKMTSKMRYQKKWELLIEFESEKVRFWMCWTHWNALYKGISVVGADYDKIKKFIKNLCQNGHQKWSRNRRLYDQGFDFSGFRRIFEVSDLWWMSLAADWYYRGGDPPEGGGTPVTI